MAANIEVLVPTRDAFQNVNNNVLYGATEIYAGRLAV